jgi:pyrimidine-nucleoside phosphorylase
MDEGTMRRTIERKRDGHTLERADWMAVIEAYMSGDVDDAQMAALAMACVWRGLSLEEIVALTAAMVESGATITYPDGAFVVDKHSSGGVSDIVSLVAVPLVAACGVRVGKLSGRALGHTGGTIDKLEAIPGFNASPGMDAFVRQVERVGCAIAAQTDAFVPADKRLYRLRDRTSTVRSVGLIAASIVSKKIAGGANGIVYDVKCGSAAFMRDEPESDELARTLVDVTESFGRRARALVTDMNEPLARCIGTGIEVIEACRLLRGEMRDERAESVCVQVSAAMLELAGLSNAQEAAREALSSGRAYLKFVEMVRAQGGSEDALASLVFSDRVTPVVAERDGYVALIDGRSLGHAARDWSARDRTAGIVVRVRIGDRVRAGDTLAEVYGSNADERLVRYAFDIDGSPPSSRPMVYARYLNEPAS